MGKKFDALEYKVNLISEKLVALTNELTAGKVIARRYSHVSSPMYPAIHLTTLRAVGNDGADKLKAVLDHLNIRLEEVKRKEEWVVVVKAPKINNP